MSIKIKLIALFILIKVIPILLIAYVAIQGAIKLNEYFNSSTNILHNQTTTIIKSTAQSAINDSIKSLDEKSQKNLEKISAVLATQVAQFLYERDEDILFLSELQINQKTLNSFFNSKNREIYLQEEYSYDNKSNKWLSINSKKTESSKEKAINKDNEKEFSIVKNPNIKTKTIPLYKEVVYFNLSGQEKYKKSIINSNKLDISNKNNTYIKAETYFKAIQKLKKGEIYVSDVIGVYVPSKIIGTFTKAKAKKAGLAFEPELHGYAGKENPKGKRFEAIIRFITPVFEKNKKVGYISLALDHRHIMEFTDNFNPIGSQTKQKISDASAGNYAFMWDYEGRNISHPRDYFIVGFNAKTGERIPGWLSKEINEDFEKSGEKDLNKFLENYPKFKNQSLKQKPNIKQLKQKGEIGLDCRYLNFAPQCEGWMQVTKDGGYGSFVIFWSKVWKLTTAAAIPYYTGEYKNSKRGFGFITIGANVDEFHAAANKTKRNLDNILNTQNQMLEDNLKENSNSIQKYITSLINELTVYSIIMILFVIIIAVWMSDYISSKINNLIKGTKEFAKNNLDYRINVSSKDEIGKLEDSFNQMAIDLKKEKNDVERKDRIMFQQSKMAAMGEMIENIAHQWRQPLSMISSMTTSIILQKKLDLISDEELEKNLHSINNNTEYLSNTINDFKSFFKPNKDLIEFNINECIEKTLSIIEPKFNEEKIIVKKEFIDIELNGLENELIQVIMNILNNAKDAFISNNIENRFIFISIKEDKDNAILTIQDTAKGIPEKIIDRIFEPYFTTKHKFQGTGIGLYMSQQIITKHMNGLLFVENNEFEYKGNNYTGAKFIISLPKSNS